MRASAFLCHTFMACGKLRENPNNKKTSPWKFLRCFVCCFCYLPFIFYVLIASLLSRRRKISNEILLSFSFVFLPHYSGKQILLTFSKWEIKTKAKQSFCNYARGRLEARFSSRFSSRFSHLCLMNLKWRNGKKWKISTCLFIFRVENLKWNFQR